jgi:hypothetical protein
MLDEATKVFKVCEAAVDQNTKLVFVDFGGHKIYNFAYQLSFKSQSVPLLVIDIAEFDRLVVQQGEEAACQDVCLDWLSHMYIACPTLCRPVVVLTHCDKISDECYNLRKQQLIDTTEKLRHKIIKSETHVASSLSPIFIMKSFTDISELLIRVDMISVFSTESSKPDIDSLKEMLVAVGAVLNTEIPGSWYVMLVDIESETTKPFIKLSEIDIKFPNDPDHVTLEYLHEIGRLMWFKNNPKLSCYVFHRHQIITGLIEILYSHTHDKDWSTRLDNFIPFEHDGKSIGEYKYQDMITTYNRSGVMEAALLINMLEKESQLPADAAVEILRSFHLVHLCGPDARPCDQKYIIPYFATRKIKAPGDFTNRIPLKVDLYLRGLKVPGYVFSLITAAYLDKNSEPFSSPAVGTNGAVVSQSNRIQKYLLHNASDNRVTLLTLALPKNVAEAWTKQLASLQQLIAELKSVWKGVRYETVFYCSHCLLTSNPSPHTEVDPSWSQTETLAANEPARNIYSGDEVFSCAQDADIPTPLMYPCE